MRERDLLRVQEHALESLPCELAVPREVAVLVVAGEREAEMREMHTNLVRTSRAQLRLEQRKRWIAPWDR